MKITEAIEIYNLCQSIKNIKMPIKTAYKFMKLINAIEPEVEFYQKKFQEILEEYAIVENGNFKLSTDNKSILIKPGYEEECHEKLNSLRDIEVEAASIAFKIEEFDKFDLSLSELKILLPYIQE